MYKIVILIIAMSVFGLSSCGSDKEKPASETEAQQYIYKAITPKWAKNAAIYELNIRQFSPEGTFRAIVPELERIADLGIDVIWLMPIHPISKTKRKGSLGSYYAVNNYREVNPEFGSEHDLQYLVSKAHNQGLRIILDWVPHHTGWDHPWIKDHPDWYSHDEEGNIIDPIDEKKGEPWGWTDVAELDLSNQEMRAEIISDMIYWIENVGVDGFRVDHAEGLPDDYLDQVSDALAYLRTPIFLLGEGEDARLRNTGNFEVTYAWKFHYAMNDIAKGKENVNVLDDILREDRKQHTMGYHMYFTSNHDENTEAGTVMERLGDGHQTFAVLACTIDGMPLLYSGQEEPMTKRLSFFEKDDIPWQNYAYSNFYKSLFQLKKRNKALWNGEDGGTSVRINTSKSVYAFKREKDGDQVVVILNLTDKAQSTTLDVDVPKMRNVFGGKAKAIAKNEKIELAPWEYIVLSSK